MIFVRKSVPTADQETQLLKGALLMLRPSISHADFLQRLDSALYGLDSSQTLRLNSDEFRLALHKVRAINLDPAVPIVSSLYSTRGRPAADPTLILCSLILMFHFGETSIQK